jgi:hypothetical protein
MSDSEIIIKSLEKAERRLRTNRLFRDLTVSLSVFLLFPLALKIWDLVSPLRGKTVAVLLFVWILSLVLYALRRTLQMSTLEQTAAQLDKMAGLGDELKTAYWFITHPRTSDWIDVQMRRASRRVSQLSIERLYPRVIPRSSYVAAALLAVLIGLNFVPLPSNHNWVYLEAAPAFSLTDAERSSLAQAQQLVKKMDALEKTDLAADIEEVMEDLQQGTLDPAEALKELGQIQQMLNTPVPDTQAADNEVSEKVQAQQFKEQALKELQSLAQSLEKRNTTSQQAAEAGGMKETGENEGDPEPGEEASAGQDGDTAETEGGSGGVGAPQNSSAPPKKEVPIEAPPTQKLDVQLQQEQLAGQYDPVQAPGDIERTSKQERSKLDYRNVRSELSPAERDVLNQERIPWEYRGLIKNYFMAIQPHKNN